MPQPRRAKRATCRALIGVTACLLGVAALPQPAAAALPTWPANPNWQSLVPAPTSDSVRAVAVTRTSGTVTNAAGLAGQGTGSTVLTTTATSNPATIILDFGKEVGGTPFITVSSSATATVRVATSEALPYRGSGLIRFLNVASLTWLRSGRQGGAAAICRGICGRAVAPDGRPGGPARPSWRGRMPDMFRFSKPVGQPLGEFLVMRVSTGHPSRDDLGFDAVLGRRSRLLTAQRGC